MGNTCSPIGNWKNKIYGGNIENNNKLDVVNENKYPKSLINNI